MGFNYAIEKAKFEREWTQLRVEYEKAGMSNEKINILHDYDWENFKKERIYAIHTQEFREAQYDNGNNSQGDKSPLFKKFLTAISHLDNYAESSRYAWLDELSDPRLTRRLKGLSIQEKELLTKYCIEQKTQAEIATELGLSQRGVGKQLQAIKKFFR